MQQLAAAGPIRSQHGPRGVSAAGARLVHAGAHVPAGQPLHLLASLQQQAAVGDADGQPAPVLEPHRESREAALAVRRQEIEVVVPPGQDGAAPPVRAQVRACRFAAAPVRARC